MASLPVPIAGSAGISFRGEIYVTGGETDGDSLTVLDTVYSYSSQRNQWRQGPSMAKPRFRNPEGIRSYFQAQPFWIYFRCLHGLVVLNGRLTAIGGRPEDEDGDIEAERCCSRTMEELDPMSNTWRLLPTILTLSACNSAYVAVNEN